MGVWVKHWADKRGKVDKLKYTSFVTSLERANKKSGWVKSLSFFADKRDKVGMDDICYLLMRKTLHRFLVRARKSLVRG